MAVTGSMKLVLQDFGRKKSLPFGSSFEQLEYLVQPRITQQRRKKAYVTSVAPNRLPEALKGDISDGESVLKVQIVRKENRMIICKESR